MNCLCSACNCNRNNSTHIQVAVLYLRGTNTVAFVGKVYMKGISVCFGKNRYGRNAHLLAGSDDTNRYFASIGNKYLGKQLLHPFNKSKGKLSADAKFAVHISLALCKIKRSF